jgi:hypothetical protein
MAMRLPTVVVPLTEDCDREQCQDIFVYLRPESNGVVVESTLMKVISRSRELPQRIRLVYLANIPGDFILRNRIIEDHYHLKLLFSRKGKKLFTPYMADRFTIHFGIPFEEADIIGAFQALRILGLTREELFQLWVPEKDLLHLNGQTIKRYKNHFIINYDIPAILHKNSDATDIAVMIFRTELGSDAFKDLITAMVTALRKEGIVDKHKPFSRVFHHSAGPFEQIRDGLGFLYNSNGEHLPLQKIRFFRFLEKEGLSSEEIKKIIAYPLFHFPGSSGSGMEDTIYNMSSSMTYPEARDVLAEATGQLLIGSDRILRPSNQAE